METLYLLLLFGLFLFINQQFVALKNALAQQRDDLSQLRRDLLSGELPLGGPTAIPNPATARQAVPERTPPPLAPPIPAPVPPVSRPILPPQPLPELEPVLSISTPEPPKASKPNLLDPSLLDERPSSVTPPKVVEAGPSWFQRFLIENPDLEKFIGENLINKIGIAILVAGIGYFVRYAIAQEWIGEIGRVLIGVVAGGGLLAVAHRLRERFAAFSSVLVAGGLSVLYFTIAIAFSDYKLFSQTAAFLLMVVITGFAVALSIAYNRVELAVMSLVGGFATPFMVSSGEGNYVVLLTYILILDCGMLVLSAFKKWPLVHWVAYAFTILLYAAWVGVEVFSYVPTPQAPQPPYVGAFVFATLFYAVFAARNLFDRLRADYRFTATDSSLFLSNTALYYGTGMALLAEIDRVDGPGGSWQGVFTLALAVLNFGYAVLLFRQKSDTTLLYLLIGLTVTFASLTIPVQLEGNFITMFWALEAVLLLWLGQRSGFRLITTASVLVLALMGISLFMDWADLYNTYADTRLPIFFNKAFVTSAIAVVGLVLYHRLLGQQTQPISLYSGELAVSPYRRFVGYVAVGVTYLAGFVELNYQLLMTYGADENRTLLLGTYHLLIAIGLLVATQRFATPFRRGLAGVVGVLVVGLYLFGLVPALISLLDSYHQGLTPYRVGFPVHYANLLLLGTLLWLLFRLKNELAPATPPLERLWPWFLMGSVVWALSGELFANVLALKLGPYVVATTPDLIAAKQNRFDALVQQTNKVGLPILWGVCAFVFMYVGLVRHNRTYRVLSLGLFALTLAKLFLYDLRGISEGGRIIAFISLGALLLIVSFMYQRIKQLIL